MTIQLKLCLHFGLQEKNYVLAGKFIVSKYKPNEKEFKFLRARILHKNIGKLK